MNIELILFVAVGLLAVISAIMMIVRPSPVKSVLFLIVNFFCLAILYLMLHAQFIAVAQIIVYAGAIMVLFLFVIMLLNVADEKSFAERGTVKKMVALFLAGVMVFEILSSFMSSEGVGSAAVAGPMLSLGTVEGIGRVLFTTYLLPFEITSLLLLAAMVCVIILAKKKFE